MAQKEKISEVLYHLLRLLAEQKTEDFQVYLKRHQKLIQENYPKLVSGLSSLKKEGSSTFRSMKMANAPVDLDTRLSLVRIVDESSLDFDPIWDKGVAKVLNQVVVERTEKTRLKEHGLRATKSVIFTGKPGVGKTLAAKWIAHKLGKPLLILDLSAVMSSFLGRTGSNLRNVIDYAKGIECVLLLDEIDAIAKKRDDSTDVGELKRLVTVMLQEIDEWPEHSLLIAATNHASLLDPAIWRRFDMEVDFPMPSTEQIAQAVDLYLGKEKIKSVEVKNCLLSLLNAASYSDVERSVMSIRRQSVIKKISLDDAVIENISQRMHKLDKDLKLRIAKTMVSLGNSQRSVSEITGISRTTLSKKINQY